MFIGCNQILYNVYLNINKLQFPIIGINLKPLKSSELTGSNTNSFTLICGCQGWITFLLEPKDKG